eukprot:CAMPEP_0197638552 /NCGR_PEP_ID=MMETSP1338-20131121/13450_1 /TAXON_ID=43686 ORGANISM="Pelagodinium beii, Strain RCC1491" /NCGR_SAMPLE_ID=MMETSP1338 /ASSEMBLY_ACC=CAM_ASM_000754 /LENGTH=540 /DNA_ID=CAMNT_0043211149 /DNA_START=90 /DNA_END=1712 /DNA_ORIENTATION=-
MAAAEGYEAVEVEGGVRELLGVENTSSSPTFSSQNRKSCLLVTGIVGTLLVVAMMLKSNLLPNAKPKSELQLWRSDMCKSQDEAAPQIAAPDLGMAFQALDICAKEFPDPHPCMWTSQYHCETWVNVTGMVAHDDGTLGYYCCCMRASQNESSKKHPFHSPAKPEIGQIIPSLRLKVLSYNLFWWKLFGVLKGANGTAGKLVAKEHKVEAFDIIGFQECMDQSRVLRDAGLLGKFIAFAGPESKCMAFRKAAWRVIKHGHETVAADVYWNNYGARGAQWMRLYHLQAKKYVFFVNFHGPLSVNSGGTCGGVATARNILKIVSKNSQEGDIVLVLGDFNANPASLLVQEMANALLHVSSGPAFGGIDNIFTNLPPTAVQNHYSLGAGGSDHNATTAIFDVGQVNVVETKVAMSQKIIKNLYSAYPGHSWQTFWCGKVENHMKYIPAQDSWIERLTNGTSGSGSPDRCCRQCQIYKNCTAWTFEGAAGDNSSNCTLIAGALQHAHQDVNFVSGLSAASALKKAVLFYGANESVSLQVRKLSH